MIRGEQSIEMAPGYVIALCLNGAGALGLAIGFRMLRAERRRAAELARFLRSGQIPDARPVPPLPIRAAGPVRVRAPTPQTTSDPSYALLAPRSAYAA